MSLKVVKLNALAIEEYGTLEGLIVDVTVSSLCAYTESPSLCELMLARIPKQATALYRMVRLNADIKVHLSALHVNKRTIPRKLKHAYTQAIPIMRGNVKTAMMQLNWDVSECVDCIKDSNCCGT